MKKETSYLVNIHCAYYRRITPSSDMLFVNEFFYEEVVKFSGDELQAEHCINSKCNRIIQGKMTATKFQVVGIYKIIMEVDNNGN